MSLMIGLLIGIMVGVLLSRFIFREKPVGSLRVDESDPDSGPYLFLELDRSGVDAIYKQRYVRLRVELKNYIYDNCASIKGRGISQQRKRFEIHLHKYYQLYGNDGYILFGDFSKF